MFFNNSQNLWFCGFRSLVVCSFTRSNTHTTYSNAMGMNCVAENPTSRRDIGLQFFCSFSSSLCYCSQVALPSGIGWWCGVLCCAACRSSGVCRVPCARGSICVHQPRTPVECSFALFAGPTTICRAVRVG